MSLLVWLPMTKDLSDQGLGGCTITNEGATLDNNGKLGKCYNFDGTNDRIKVSGLNNPKNITVAFWMKRNATTGTRQFLFTAWNGISIELGAANNLFGKVYTSSGEAGGASGGTVTADSGWIHVCYTFEDKVGGKMYINGVLTGSGNTTSSIAWNVTGGYIGNYSNIYLNAKLNDFRIYDHALSPKEVEVLSRGLVCHYPLNNNGGGQPNLYDFESVASKWVVDGLTLANTTDDVYGNVLEITSPSSVSSQRIYRSVSNVWKADTKFTVSFLAKASKTAVVKMSRSLENYAPDVTVGTTWKRYSTVITCSTTAEGGTLSIQTSTASANIYITQIKLELGDKATVYCPGVGDSHYIPLGYDSTTEYDVSGYGYNGTKTGTFVYDIDTPRYSVCTKYSGGNYSYVTSPSSEIRTIAFWAKWDTIPSGQSILFVDGKSKTGFGLASNGIICSSNSVQTYTFNKSNLVANVWYHFVVVCPNGGSNTARKLYINGVEQTATSNQNYWSYSTEQLQIGKRSSSSDGLVGKMSDFRAYATALSAEQVAELYNTAVSVANNGTLMGYELVEV